MRTTSFDRTAGLAAFLAALTGLLYSVSFVVLQNALLYSLCLMAGGLLSLVALVALFERLGEVDAKVAMLGLMLGSVAALGATIHGGYDLANVLNPPPALPNQIDPRGLLTFGVAGLAVLIAGGLMRRHPQFSRSFTALTFLLGVLLLVVYLGRLIVLTPTSPLVLLPAAVTGFVVSPLWYLLLGLSLRRNEAQASAPTHAPA